MRIPRLTLYPHLHAPLSPWPHPTIVLVQRAYFRSKPPNESKSYRNRSSHMNPVSLLDRHRKNAAGKDDNDNDEQVQQFVNPKSSKLNQGLEPTETKKLTDRAQGTADAMCAEIAVSLNNCLSSDKLYGSFKGFKIASDIFDIDRCEANLDFSDVTVYWSSGVVKNVLHAMTVTTDEDNAERLRIKIINGITKKLQSKESVFRSTLMKDIYFKKVPKLIFRSTYETKNSKFRLTAEMVAELNEHSS
jgi:ribosome-binding factor A